MNWRPKFIELCESIFRQLGFPPPSMLFEDNLPLAMELELEETAFELFHAEGELGRRVLVICRLGDLPAVIDLSPLRAFMARNLVQAREDSETFGIHQENRELRAMFYEDLESISSEQLMARMRSCARRWRDWHEIFFQAEDSIDNAAKSSILLA